jgi:hypothetical protein
MTRIDLIAIEVVRNEKYEILDDDGLRFVMRREYGETPSGNPINGNWVLRDRHEEWVDCDQYRYDLFSRYEVAKERHLTPAPIEPAGRSRRDG